MSLTATFTDASGVVALAATSAPSNATTALFERSTDQITWTQVRGGQAVPVAAGSASLKDFEYAAGVTNYYRVSWASSSPVSFVAAGTAATGNNTSVVPALPAGRAAGDLLLCLATIRNNGVGVPVAPAGWTKVAGSANVALFARRHATGDTAPTVTFTGGVTGADTVAQIAAFRNADTVYQSAFLANTSAQNITLPALTSAAAGVMLLLLGWKQAISTGTTLAGWTSIGSTSSAAGSGATDAWYYQFEASATVAPGGGLITVTGGSAAISIGGIAVVTQAPYVTRDTTTVTPAQTGCWLKNPVRPFLNRKVTVVDFADLTRASRSGVFDVIGRTDQVGVTDLMSGRSTTITIRTTNPTEADDLDLMIAVGEVLFLQPAYQAAPPTFYFVPGSPARSRVANTSAVRRFSLPATEVAQPDPSLAAVQSTWQTVVSTYATWADLIAAKATWNDVLNIVGSVADVVTS